MLGSFILKCRQAQLQPSVYGTYQAIQPFLIMPWLFLLLGSITSGTLYGLHGIFQVYGIAVKNEKYRRALRDHVVPLYTIYFWCGMISITWHFKQIRSTWARCNDRRWLQSSYTITVCMVVNFMQLWFNAASLRLFTFFNWMCHVWSFCTSFDKFWLYNRCVYFMVVNGKID